MLNKVLENVSTIAIGGHIRPDGDCVGSCVGLGQYIRENYSDKTVDIYLKDIPESFHFLNGTETILESVDNEEKIYDMKEMLKFDYYKNLREKENLDDEERENASKLLQIVKDNYQKIIELIVQL